MTTASRLMKFLVKTIFEIKSVYDWTKGSCSGICHSFANSTFSRNCLVVLTRRVIREMIRDDASHLAAGVAYFAIFSLFPVLLGILAIAGAVLDSEEAKEGFLQYLSDGLPGSEQFISSIVPVIGRNIETFVAFKGPLALISIVGLVWSATGVLAAIGRAVDRAWDITYNRPYLVAKARQFLMGVVLGVPLFLSFLAQSAEEVLSELAADQLGIHWTWLISTLGDLTLRTIDWGLVLLVFMLAYRFVPNTKTYWRYVWLGAAAATVMYQAGLELFIWYLEHIASYDTVYGPVSSVMVFLLWIYLSALILVLGAEISSECERMHQSAEGDPARP